MHVKYDDFVVDTVSLHFGRRSLSGVGLGITTPLILSGLSKSDMHEVVLDFFPDWRTPDNGGTPYYAVYYNGVLQYEDTTLNTLPSDAAEFYNFMWGTYRYNEAAKSANGTCIVFHELGIKNATYPLKQLIDAPDRLSRY